MAEREVELPVSDREDLRNQQSKIKRDIRLAHREDGILHLEARRNILRHMKDVCNEYKTLLQNRQIAKDGPWFVVKNLPREEVLAKVKELLQCSEFLIQNRSKKLVQFVNHRFVLKDVKERVSCGSSVPTVKARANLIKDILREAEVALNSRSPMPVRSMLYNGQGASNYRITNAIYDVCCLIGCRRDNLNFRIVCSGCFAGNIIMKDKQPDPTDDDIEYYECSDNDEGDADGYDKDKDGGDDDKYYNDVAGNEEYRIRDGRQGEAIPIPGNLSSIVDLECRCGATFVLLIEKKSVFNFFVDARFWIKLPCILICSSGQGDISTRGFVRRVHDESHLPIFSLVDCNAPGLEISSVFQYGSKDLAFDSDNMITPNMAWIGLKMSHLDVHGIPKESRVPIKDIKSEVPMKEGDAIGEETIVKQNSQLEKIEYMLKQQYVKENPEWVSHLQSMLEERYTVQLDAIRRLNHTLNRNGKKRGREFNYLVDFYIFYHLNEMKAEDLFSKETIDTSIDNEVLVVSSQL